MKLLIDTNIVLDVLLQREPHFVASSGVWKLAEEKRITAILSAITFNNAFYVLRKPLGWERSLVELRKLRDVFDVVDLTARSIDDAIAMSRSDFEDSLQIATAVSIGAEGIVTRDRTGFTSSPVSVLSPNELLARLST